jgi:aspartyl-tRNA(Asn)/glutamyl-tRNA(Gln) amidotransferase subunit A
MTTFSSEFESGSTPESVGSCVGDLGRLQALASDIASGALSPVDLVERCLERIAEIDPAVQCWRVVDGDRARAVAEERLAEARAGRTRGLLHGIPIGVKDVIDVAGLTTLANSKSREGCRPADADAEIVLALKRQGAIILGKVHTTEYAFFDPSPARNPHKLAHTPGGSSSGSAASVAAGMVPLALGTQTVASVNRPASYCGISAFKPSTRSTAMYGITPLAPSYDTVGFMAKTVDDAVYAFTAAAAPFACATQGAEPEAALQIVVPEDPHLDDCDDAIVRALDRAASELAAAGHKVDRVAAPIDFAHLCKLQRATMLYEAGRALAFLLAFPEEAVGAKLRQAILDGQAIAESTYLDARAEIDAMRTTFWSAMAETTCLWPANPQTAPEGLAWTGDPKYISPWTALAGPVVSVPLGLAPDGLPIGALISSAPGTDRQMCATARTVAGIVEAPPA